MLHPPTREDFVTELQRLAQVADERRVENERLGAAEVAKWHEGYRDAMHIAVSLLAQMEMEARQHQIP